MTTKELRKTSGRFKNLTLQNNGMSIIGIAEMLEDETKTLLRAHHYCNTEIGFKKFQRFLRELGLEGDLSSSIMSKIHNGDITMLKNTEMRFSLETEQDTYLNEEVIKNIYVQTSFDNAIKSLSFKI